MTLRQRNVLDALLRRVPNTSYIIKAPQETDPFPDAPPLRVAQATLYICGPPLCATTPINDALTHERPRSVHGFTTAVKKRLLASGLSQQATLTNTAVVTGHGYHRRRRATEG